MRWRKNNNNKARTLLPRCAVPKPAEGFWQKRAVMSVSFQEREERKKKETKDDEALATCRCFMAPQVECLREIPHVA